MEVYILFYYDYYEGSRSIMGLFTSEAKAHEYLQKYLSKHSIFEEKDFEIDSYELDPDTKWMEE